jgi:aspartyl-tRNA(Asn)/glutamyl-tRNA(Gln) amidotransferase subunit A
MKLQDGWNRRDFVRVTASAAAGAAALPGLPGYSHAAAATPTATQSDELARLTIAQASRMIRARAISCTELTQACLARAEAYNPTVNAFITIMHEEALAQARQLDAEASGGNFRGPLHGIPVGLKDNIDTAGTRTTGGSLVF